LEDGVKEDNHSHQPPPSPRRKGTPDAYANGSDRTHPIDTSPTNWEGADHGRRTDPPDDRRSEGPPASNAGTTKDASDLEAVLWLEDLRGLQAIVQAEFSEGRAFDRPSDPEWFRATIKAADKLEYRLVVLSKETKFLHGDDLRELKRSLVAENTKMLARQAQVPNAQPKRSSMKPTTQGGGKNFRNPKDNAEAPPPNANHRGHKEESKSLAFASLLMLRNSQLRG
jgi:hypothetical protein